MTKYPHLFGNPKEDLDQLCANIVKFRQEKMIAAIEEGRNCDQDFMLACMGLLDGMITEIEKNPDVMIITGVPTENTEDYFYHKFEHLVENETEASQRLHTKETEVSLIVSYFEYFIKNKVSIEDKEVTIRQEFRREFLDWYRKEDGRPIGDEKSIRDYIDKTSINFALDDYIFDFKIKQNKEIIINFFNRNDINRFNPKRPEVKILFGQFYKYAADLIE